MYDGARSAIDKQRLDRELMPPPSIVPLLSQFKRTTDTEQSTQKINLGKNIEPLPITIKKIEPSSTINDEKSLGEEEIDKAFQIFLTEINEINPDNSISKENNKNESQSEDLLPLESPWKEVLEPTTNRIYYWNIQTNEVSWNKPHNQIIYQVNQKSDFNKNEINSKDLLNHNLENDSNFQSKNVSDLKTSEANNFNDASHLNLFLVPTSTLSTIDSKIKEFIKQIEILGDFCNDEKASLDFTVNNFKNNLSIQPKIISKKNEKSPFNHIESLKQDDDEIPYSEILFDYTSLGDKNSDIKSNTLLSEFLDVEQSQKVEEKLPSTVNFDSITSKESLENKNIEFVNLEENYNKEIMKLLSIVSSRLSFFTSTSDYNFKLGLKIQTETRMTDWFAGGLSASYFLSILNETINKLPDLTVTEDDATSIPVLNDIYYSNNLPQEDNSLLKGIQDQYNDITNSSQQLTTSTSQCDTYNFISPIEYSIESPDDISKSLSTSKFSSAALYSEQNTKLHPLPEISVSQESNMDQDNSHKELFVYKDERSHGDSHASKRKLGFSSTFTHRKKLQLVDQWKKSAQLAELEDLAANPDVVTLEHNRLKQEEIEIEKWKEFQISSGAAERNVNFIPLPNDWRNFQSKNIDSNT